MQFVCIEKVANLTVYDNKQHRVVRSMTPDR
jgi:hypothetical protein